ncbi:MAG TPA: flagellar basal-body MS-ring/collar protein FliF [Rickettsiales bacterium]|nr:flagellar basal-body MS-ring/collar protein FliF [Rickettsiales bacterium]
MNSFLQSFKDLSQMQMAILAAVIITVLSMAVFMSAHFSTQSLAPLYTDLSMEDSGKIVAELDKSGVQYDLRGNGTQIYVPTEQVLKLRLSLAQQGLPALGSIVGYEIFDRSDTMGTSSFVMNINMLRALEGELSRTIASLTQVESARVHLVIPKEQLFSKDKQEATASVVIKLRGMRELGKAEVDAITHLVAASVPGLKPTNVTILDTLGHMLSGGSGEATDMLGLASSTEEYRVAYQNRMRNTLEGLLEKSLGAGKVKVSVNADIDFDRVVTNSETYDPNGQVARSVQTGEDKEQTTDKEGSQNTSASTNLPNGQSNQSSNGSSRIIAKTDETTNYEISKTVQNHIKQGGTVKKLSVAVMVDGTYAEDKSGKEVYTPRTKENLDEIQSLVKSAIGFDDKRGDIVDVVNMRFIAENGEEGNMSFVESLKQDLHGVVQTLVFGAVAVLVVLLVIRPIVNRIIETTMADAAAEAATGGAAAIPQTGALFAGTGAGAPAPIVTAGAAMDIGDESEEGSIDISRVTGRVKSSSYNRLNELVEKHPEEALNVIRQWASKRS